MSDTRFRTPKDKTAPQFGPRYTADHVDITHEPDLLPSDPLPNDRWETLENDIRTTLLNYNVDDQLWLVHDLLVNFRLCLTVSGLVTFDTATNYFRMFPERLEPHDATDNEITSDAALT